MKEPRLGIGAPHVACLYAVCSPPVIELLLAVMYLLEFGVCDV